MIHIDVHDERRRWDLLVIWSAAIVYAALLLAHQGGGVIDLLFNDMFAHLLRGRFDVDPAAVQLEAFRAGGGTYAYFGVFCALLRAPLFLIGQPELDVTKLSVLMAAGLSLWARLRALDMAIRVSGAWTRSARFVALSATAIGGESVQYLVPDVYQEAVSWGAALSAVFVLLTLRLALGQVRRRSVHLTAMAVVAGLALLCRFSFGFGAGLAMAAILTVELVRGGEARPTAVLGRVLPAAIVLALFAGAAAGVNYARWGDPFSFAPVERQALLQGLFPDRLPRVTQQGVANLARLPFALQYYLAPIWVMKDAAGRLLFQDFQVRMFDTVELPPSTFLLSDPAACLLALFGLRAQWRPPSMLKAPAQARLATVALAAPAALMLVAISLTFRYRMEFYPALDLCACLGAAALTEGGVRKLEVPLRGARILGATAAAGGLLLYHLAPLNSATDLDLSRGWLAAVLDVAKGRNVVVGHLMPDGRRIPIRERARAADPRPQPGGVRRQTL
jgi:hypothetical protein